MFFETKAIHVGQQPDSTTGAVTLPIYQTSTYQQCAVGVYKGYDYSRTGNPTRSALEELLAALENAKYGIAFASGLAAATAVFNLLKSGDHVLVGDDLYGGTYRLLEHVFKQWGLQATYFDMEDFDSIEKLIQSNTKMIWVETPTNPLLKIIDIQKLSQIAKKHNLLFSVDNTFASPFFQKPLDLGADIVVHSTTKYLSGHSDIIGGAVITSSDSVNERIKFYQNAAGAVPGPFDSWLVVRGIKTLAIRMKEHEKNASVIANFLNHHKRVDKVYYPGLLTGEKADICKNQMTGWGGMVSFELKGNYSDVELFFSKLKVFTLAESLGGVESLACYPAKMTHASFTKEQQLKKGIKENLIRLSVGIENCQDLLNDIENALK